MSECLILFPSYCLLALIFFFSSFVIEHNAFSVSETATLHMQQLFLPQPQATGIRGDFKSNLSQSPSASGPEVLKIFLSLKMMINEISYGLS